MINAMSVDVEDYFHVSAFETCIGRDQWDRLPLRVEQNTSRILELFAEAGVKATFFMLGWVAERAPGLVREIVHEGHELASHGYEHVRVSRQNRHQFAEDVRRTKRLLEDLGGTEVLGYRAASYSINRDNLWALDVLREEGHRYSSSIYPIRHDLYGMPQAPRFPFRVGGEDGIVEVPITTARVAGRRFPGGGGGYFRLLPYRFYRRMLMGVNRGDGEPGVFYFHPWEIDPEQPRQHQAPARSRFRHYINLGRMEGRLKRLLRDFRWGRMDEVFLGREYPVVPLEVLRGE